MKVSCQLYIIVPDFSLFVPPATTIGQVSVCGFLTTPILRLYLAFRPMTWSVTLPINCV